MSTPSAHPLFAERSAGVLLPLSSLPGSGGGGLLADPALRFIDWLADAGFHWWQMLPVGPPGAGGSPYASPSAFAGDPSLAPTEGEGGGEFDEAGFRSREGYWLGSWAKWRSGGDDPERVEAELRAQARFQAAWDRLRKHAASRGVRLIGDLPIYVEHDSADVATHPELFRLGPDNRPEVVTGVPPDSFSATGQLWGHPHYRWEIHRALDFRWWRERFLRQLRLFDVVRIDHFVGFHNGWEIPSQATTAVNGRWRLAPGSEIFAAVLQDLIDAGQPAALPFIAEDLGEVTLPVEQLRDQFALPGMRILQYAFDVEDSPHLPENAPVHSVAYPGTHDNDTLNGWLTHMEARKRAQILRYTEGIYATMVRDLVRKLLAGNSNLVILPMADLLGLGSEARINTPATTEGNWQWRMEARAASRSLAAQVRDWLEQSGRLVESAS